VKKYSGVTGAEVDLQLSGQRLEITVRDQGRGFDVANLPRSEALGIRSVEQRLSIGRKGTTVTASVPVKPAARKASTS
jgi:signal transduction histidine kinase